jgi:hypothetical protein
MEERGVRDRVNNSQAYIWEDAVLYANYPTHSTYTNAQVGDFVNFDATGSILRSPSRGALSEYQGLVVGIAPDSGEYPAFGAHLNRPLVALLSPNKTELIVRQINDAGSYVSPPTLNVGALTMFVYNATTRRWGVQLKDATNPATGRVMQVLSDGRLVILLGN